MTSPWGGYAASDDEELAPVFFFSCGSEDVAGEIKFPCFFLPQDLFGRTVFTRKGVAP